MRFRIFGTPIETQPTDFQQREKRNKLINLINWPWIEGFIKISVYSPFLWLRNLFFRSAVSTGKNEHNEFSASESVVLPLQIFNTFHISYGSKALRFFSHHKLTLFIQFSQKIFLSFVVKRRCKKKASAKI